MIINFDLEFGRCNGVMDVDIYSNDHLILSLENHQHTSSNFSIAVEFPTVLKFMLSGKNLNVDTKIDANTGKIIEDKFVIIKNMTVGRIPINPAILFKICKYHKNDSNEIVYDTYWGFNGQVDIHFNETDFIKWHLANNNLFYI